MLIDNIVVVIIAIISIIIIMDNCTIIPENKGKVNPIVNVTAITNVTSE